MEYTFYFLQVFLWSIYLLAPLLMFLALFVIVLGLVVCKLERWNKFDAIYWAFITASTVGYGDIRPLRKPSKMLSIFIAVLGMVCTGIIIAASVNAASLALERYVDPVQIEIIKQRVN